MKADLISYNVVVLASIFNPTVFSEPWLQKLGVLSEGDRLTGSIFTDMAVVVNTARFQMSLVPQQLVLAPQGVDIASTVSRDVLGRIIPGLPHTPYTGAGVNFAWRIDPETEAVSTATRRLFAKEDGRIAQAFAAADAHFGAYMSQDVGGGVRLKLDMKPVRRPAVGDEPAVDTIQLTFNFHLDTKGDAAATNILALVDRWAEFSGMADALAHKLIGVPT